MAVVLKCNNGHEWTCPDTAEAVVACPECGERVPNLMASDTAKGMHRTVIVPPAGAINSLAPSDAGETDGTAAQLEVPGYEILGELGQGASGVVYKARQTRLNRIVALKVLVTGGHDASFSRAQTESEAVAQLQHPGIVQIFEVQEDNDRLFFAFEYVEGGALNADDVRTPRQAAELLEQISRAVHHAHQQGVLHRDLKPDNILLTVDGVPKVADFGLARKMQNDAGQTQDGAILGTPYYMSPEQAAGDTATIGRATDIYSLGGILYRLLTGHTVFDDDNVIHLLQKVQSDPPVSPRRIAPNVHADLDTICLKCLEKKPGDRYATALDLANDLRRFLDGESIHARALNPVIRVTRWIRKRSMAVCLSLALLLSSGFVTISGLSSAREAEARLAARAPVHIAQPNGLPPFSVPSDNPVTHGKVELGKQLFFDRRLSADDTIACVDCHDPMAGWADPNRSSVGIGRQKGTRNSPPVANAAYLHFLFWDGRVTSLEDQAIKPITNPMEMGVESLEELAKKLHNIRGYRDQFTQVFDDGVTPQNIGAALTAFERTLVAADAPYDRYAGGDVSALSPQVRRGMDLFFNEAHCSACHSGPLFTDGGFHNIGVGRDSQPSDDGRFSVTGRRGDRGSFKTPSLRDIARTAPYMHDGSFTTLEDVVRFYVKGGTPNPALDEEIYPLDLSDEQQADLVAFLREGLASGQYPQVEAPALPE